MEKSEYLFKLKFIALFLFSLFDQFFDTKIMIVLLSKGHPIPALLFLLTDLLPGVIFMLRLLHRDNWKWNWKRLLYSCHPINMIVWPIIVICNPSEKNKAMIQVRKIYCQCTIMAFVISTIPNVTHFTL